MNCEETIGYEFGGINGAGQLAHKGMDPMAAVDPSNLYGLVFKPERHELVVLLDAKPPSLFVEQNKICGEFVGLPRFMPRSVWNSLPNGYHIAPEPSTPILLIVAVVCSFILSAVVGKERG